MKSRRNRALLAAVVGVEVVSAVLGWRDLARRDATTVRGKKRMWRVLMAMNPGNSVLYWAFGRCR
jgi:hypothetical protein